MANLFEIHKHANIVCLTNQELSKAVFLFQLNSQLQLLQLLLVLHINSIEDIGEDSQTESESIFSTLTFRLKFHLYNLFLNHPWVIFFEGFKQISICWGVTKCEQWWDERQKINYEANNDRNLTKLTTHCLDIYQNEAWQFFRPHLPPIMVSVLCIESGVVFLSGPKSNQNYWISTAKFY